MAHIDEMLDIFDENGTKTGTATFSEAHKTGLLHEVVCCYFFRDTAEKEVLIAQRGLKMATNPGKWGVSAGGHVQSGQSLEDAMRMEIQEELFSGDPLPPLKLTYLGNFRSSDLPMNNEIVHLYKTYYNGPFHIDPEEVAAVQWVTTETLEETLTTNPGMFAGFFFTNYPEFKQMNNAGTARS